jgi:hypothetical protein
LGVSVICPNEYWQITKKSIIFFISMGIYVFAQSSAQESFVARVGDEFFLRKNKPGFGIYQKTTVYTYHSCSKTILEFLEICRNQDSFAITQINMAIAKVSFNKLDLIRT